MPAPTALQRRPQEFADDVAEASSIALPAETEGELVNMDIDHVAAADAPAGSAEEDTPMTNESGKPIFPAAKSIPLAFRRETRKVLIPPHRMTPLKSSWPK
jgi:RNA-binding protein PNO1